MATMPTLSATTAEDGLYELLVALRNMQTSATQNPDGNTLITAMSLNQVTGLLTASVQLDVSQTTDINGQAIINVVEDFVD